MKKILVSQCLWGGKPVRYDGKTKALVSPLFFRWKAEGRLIPVCPEVAGGLPTPRTDAQRLGDSVISRTGKDVTENYSIGAQEALKLAKEHGVVCAIMKEKSPSCGSHLIYDGSFTGRLIAGEGLTTELLRKAGIPVFSEAQLDEADRLIRGIKNIVLIGMPASGKSVLGVITAKAMKMKFIDADLLIQEQTGKALQEIIDDDGVEGFKKIEEEVLKGINVSNTVIATGGSAVYYKEAMNHLGKDSIIVYLDADFSVVQKRLNNIKTRGVAMGKGQTLKDIYEARKPLYEEYADIVIKTGDEAIEETAERLIRDIAKYNTDISMD